MRSSTFTALVTAFRDDESIDFPALRRQAERQIAAGNDLFVCGTNADFSSLTFAEKVAVVEACVPVARGRSRLIANAGCPSTHETVLLAKEFAALGVEAVAAITPYFVACTQEGLYRHYSRVADSVGVPVYVYEIPARTGNSIEVETIARLSRHGNVKGIKDSSGKADRIDALAELCSRTPCFELYNGTDSLILYALRKGARGCVSGLANVVPGWVRSIADAADAGQAREADEAQAKVNELREKLYAHGYPPAMVKRALFLMDPSVGNNRLPALVPSEAVDSDLAALLDSLGIPRA